MSLDSMKEIFDRMEAEHKPFWEIVLETDMDERQVTRQQSMAKMLTTWQYMVDAADTYTGRRRSVSGLVGGDGLKMRQYSIRGRAMSGGYVSEVIAEALSMAESNACMRRIVAAPTAGACGVLPAVLLPMCKYEELSQHRILEALYVASGIGAVIAYKACIAGASGGCQAEIGTASAMAAGALVALRDGTGQQIGHAVAMALKNLMGLVCDPVAGLVEVPCVKRNVIGAVNAISAADMALAGIESRIPENGRGACTGASRDLSAVHCIPAFGLAPQHDERPPMATVPPRPLRYAIGITKNARPAPCSTAACRPSKPHRERRFPWNSSRSPAFR